MLHFQTSRRRRVPNYLQRSEQIRLLALVMLLGLVVILMGRAAQPENVAWLWKVFGEAPAEAPLLVGEPPPDAADSRQPPLDENQLAHLERQSEPPSVVDDRSRVQPPRQPIQVAPVDDPLAAVDPALLAVIRDDTMVTVRADELPAYYHLLGILAGTPAAKLEAASIGKVTQLQLASQPREYRGQLVTIQGRARRAMRRPLPENELGVRENFEVWVQPPDRAEPITLYCLQLPVGFPLGEAIDEPIRFTGFVFKRWVFDTPRGVANAPLVLAHTIDWNESQTAAADQRPVILPPWVMMLAALGVMWLLVRLMLAPKPQSLPMIRTTAGTAPGQADEELSDEEIGRRLRALAETDDSSPTPA